MKERIKNIIIYILIAEARMMLALHKPKVVAVTGSVGKTGAKDAIAAALGAKYHVHKSPKSFNSELGVPLTILNLPNAWNNPFLWIYNIIVGAVKLFTWRSYPEVLVLEVGADKPGDIAQMAQWLKTDVVVITAVPEVPVHVEQYPTPEAVLKEKGALIYSLKDGGVLITGDDERVATLENERGITERVTKPLGEIVHAHGVPTGMQFTLGESNVYLGGVLGEHQGYAPAFALAVAAHMNVPCPEVVTALEQMPRVPGRMRLVEGKNGSIIIDDSYNSSPTALAAALDALGKIEAVGRKVAILGDMRELGEHTEREHRRAGVRAAQVVDTLYTVGEYVPALAQAAREEGLSDEHIHEYSKDAAQQAGRDCAPHISKGDVVLVKSSQGKLRLERAVKELMQYPEQASEMLVRQENEWLKR